MRFVDTHCHLDDRRFTSDREAMLDRARQAGVERFVSIGTGDGPPDLGAGIRMADAHSDVFATVGVHPHDAAKASDDTWTALKELAQHPKVLWLGEMGLDFFYDNSPRDVQAKVFRRQLELAAELRVPVVIHTREAWAETIRCIREVWGNSGVGGIFHCFSGGPAEAQEAVELGFHLGIGGVVTFPRSVELRQAVESTELNRLVLETDAPYLAPVPHRGKRNEPGYLLHTAAQVAELKHMAVEVLAEQTSKNFQELCFAANRANQ